MSSILTSRENTVRADGPWAYAAFAADTPPAAFGPLAPIVELWRSKWRGPGRFPAWRDFDILEFHGWWGQLSLAELRLEPLDLRWRLWGTKLTLWWGTDYTDQWVNGQTHIAGVWQQFERPYFACLLEHRLVGFVSGSLEPQDRGYEFVYGVDLPLETDGGISHYLSAYLLRDKDDAFTPDARELHRF